MKIGSQNLDWHKRGGGRGDHKHLDCQSFLSSPVSESLDDDRFNVASCGLFATSLQYRTCSIKHFWWQPSLHCTHPNCVVGRRSPGTAFLELVLHVFLLGKIFCTSCLSVALGGASGSGASRVAVVVTSWWATASTKSWNSGHSRLLFAWSAAFATM